MLLVPSCVGHPVPIERLRFGRLARDLTGGKIDEILIEFDANSSLATTHENKGTDMGLFGGVLGWEAHDERLVDATQTLQNILRMVYDPIATASRYHASGKIYWQPAMRCLWQIWPWLVSIRSCSWIR